MFKSCMIRSGLIALSLVSLLFQMEAKAQNCTADCSLISSYGNPSYGVCIYFLGFETSKYFNNILLLGSATDPGEHLHFSLPVVRQFERGEWDFDCVTGSQAGEWQEPDWHLTIEEEISSTTKDKCTTDAY